MHQSLLDLSLWTLNLVIAALRVRSLAVVSQDGTESPASVMLSTVLRLQGYRPQPHGRLKNAESWIASRSWAIRVSLTLSDASRLGLSSYMSTW